MLNGYDFGSANLVVVASNVTIENCTFDKTGGYFAIGVYNTPWSPATTNTTVTGCTFIGNPASTLAAVINSPTGAATITNNKFLDTAGDGVDVEGGGRISGNYFSEAGNDGAAGHPDAIWITNSTKPLTVSDNFIDWSKNPAATVIGTNDAVRITGEEGPVSNATVTGNYLLNGATSIQAIDVAGQGALTNLSITDNYLEGATYYTFYPGPMTGSTVSGNVVVDETSLAGASSTPVTIARGGGAESIASAGQTHSLAFHPNETIDAGGAATPETFAFSRGFGAETIKGFATSGAKSDTLELSTSAFSGLHSGMSDAQKLAAVLSSASGTSGSATIADGHGDTLTLPGVSAATLEAHPGLVKFT